MKIRINKTILEILKGDITDQKTDCIVNPANSRLIMGGGVAGAIRKKGGLSIQEECNKIGYVSIGEAVITTGGKLPARYVIHAVGPMVNEHHADEKLKDATLNSLKLAEKKNLRSITFPAISTGIFGFPKDRCALIMLSTTLGYLEGLTQIERVVFCLYNKKILKIFKNTIQKIRKNLESK